jgi:hypothetical protein
MNHPFIANTHNKDIFTIFKYFCVNYAVSQTFNGVRGMIKLEVVRLKHLLSFTLSSLCLEGRGGDSVGGKGPSKTTIKSVFVLYTKFSYRLRVALSNNIYSETLFFS